MPSSKPHRKPVDWYCQECGPKTAPPLIFLHGFMGISDDWCEVTEQLKSQYRCITPDMPGHGRSGLPIRREMITIESVADGIIALMEQLKLKKATLVGYSLGGRAALFTALRHPDKIHGLVLESAGPGLEDEYERRVRTALDDDRAYHLRVQGLDPFLDDWYKAPLFESLNRFPDKLERLKRSRDIHNVEDLAAALQGLSTGRQPSLWNKLDGLKTPVLLICGALDHKFTRINRIMAESIPFNEWKIIGDAGHNTHLEQPEAFTTTVQRFLADKVHKI
ncbi:MAG: 2-succinyl-6-hydroxy-2,4-cyclohexadiene-1-carboxylate synthase [Candidatus Zixiibacteriota bacterium]